MLILIKMYFLTNNIIFLKTVYQGWFLSLGAICLKAIEEKE